MGERAGLAATFDAEYVALTQFQADALVTENADLAAAAADLVRVESFDALMG